MELRRALRAAQEQAAYELGWALRALALAERALAYSRPAQLERQQARMLQASMQPERAPLEAAQQAQVRLRQVQAQVRAQVQLQPEPAQLERAQPEPLPRQQAAAVVAAASGSLPAAAW